jgi:hypothetical protein
MAQGSLRQLRASPRAAGCVLQSVPLPACGKAIRDSPAARFIPSEGRSRKSATFAERTLPRLVPLYSLTLREVCPMKELSGTELRAINGGGCDDIAAAAAAAAMVGLVELTIGLVCAWMLMGCREQ